MLRVAAVTLLLATLPPRVALAPAVPYRLQVVQGPTGEETPFRLSAVGAAIQLEGGGVLAAGHDSLLTAPLGLELAPGATALLEGTVSLLVLPAASGGPTTELLGPRIRIARDAAGRYRVLEAREGRQLTVRVF